MDKIRLISTFILFFLLVPSLNLYANGDPAQDILINCQLFNCGEKTDKQQKNEKDCCESYYQKFIELNQQIVNQAINDKHTLETIFTWIGGILTGLGVVLLFLLGFFGIREWSDIHKLKGEMQRSLIKLKDAEKAHETYEREIQSLNAFKHQNNAQESFSKGLYQIALNELDQIISDPELNRNKDTNFVSQIKAKAFSWKAYILAFIGRDDEALGQINQGLEHNPMDPYLLFNGACINARLNKEDTALKLLKSLIHVNPDYRNLIVDSNNNIKDSDLLQFEHNSEFKKLLQIQ